MNDFEVHPIGTRMEIAASRELARAIEQITIQYGIGIVPQPVWNAYQKLFNIYQKQIESGEL